MELPSPEPILGCYRLEDPAVIRAALDAGVRTLDTADVYGTEALVGAVLADWDGEPVRVVTKVGLVRPRKGPWRADGRRKHLLEAAEASCERLGRVPDLLLLHALDGRTRLSTSVRALATAVDRGLAGAVGVANLRLGELAEAREHADLAALQVAVSPFDEDAVRGGAVRAALEAGLEVQAHSPFGGPRKAKKLARMAPFPEVGAAVGRSSWAVVLAWLRSLGLATVAGPTTVEHVDDLFGPPALGPAELEAIDAHFPVARVLRTEQADRRPPPGSEGDVVLLMGSPASGKTTAVKPFVDQGYLRLNRDTTGGTLAQVSEALDAALAAGERRVVLDNTYPARAQRNRVVETAWRHGVPVRCLYKTTGLEEARLNACLRMVRRHGRLLEPDEMKALQRTEPNSFPPRVLVQWPGKLEEPSLDEGFTEVVHLPFERSAGGTRRALVLDAAAIRDHGPTEGQRAQVEQALADGWLVFAVGWTGGGPAPGDVVFDGVPIPTKWCTHPPGPPVCWCRPPLPGLLAELIVEHDLRP